ncbi:LysR substrate-binding domain-containing protein [Paraburkholderia lacunae]|uniref:LysR family transcriptional regulator n=1 Tax=Paraburkholderia lacunae TaxID=2211104 RepID=A0A370NB51_9BURK|nr:LysR substrate-binding domain-containing protein [Paraburkholderia lacunae]RDK02738.1 LysR family transcriptional regulator [Paraburkholderia lacunae]
MDNLNSLTIFVQAAQHESFTTAGRMLGISSSAVCKSITRLEERLGVRLFHRNTRQISLTQEGAQFFARCRDIVRDLEDAEAELSRSVGEPRGRVRVSFPAVGYRLIARALPAFRRLYPQIELDLDFSDRIVDLVEESFDAVVRSGDLPDSSLMSKPLGQYRFNLYASPDFLNRHGEPESLDALPAFDGIYFKYPSNGKLQTWTLKSDNRVFEARISPAAVMNNIEGVLAACVSGTGIAYLPDFVAREAFASGALCAILTDYSVTGTFWVLWPSSRHLLPKNRALIDFMALSLFPKSAPDALAATAPVAPPAPAA